MSQEKNEKLGFSKKSSGVVLKDVTKIFQQPDTGKDFVAVDHINLEIKDGEMVTLLGPSGCGKTTTLRMISGFEYPTSGNVFIGDRDVAKIPPNKRGISMVFQSVYLFNDTVENNIKFGCPGATHKQVVEAAKKACCHDFISALPDGYHTVIGEGGATLSGGEKRRVSIARVLPKDAPIVILDEATSSVDTRTELHIDRGMEQLMKDRTTFVIAHRLSTVRNADCIMVLEQGQIIERGTHDELLEKKGRYYQLYTGAVELA